MSSGGDVNAPRSVNAAAAASPGSPAAAWLGPEGGGGPELLPEGGGDSRRASNRFTDAVSRIRALHLQLGSLKLVF